MRFLLIVSLFFLPFSFPSFSQSINTDAADQYWEMISYLKQDRPIPDPAWSHFVSIPGNLIYLPQVYDSASLGYYRRAMEIVYMPKNDSLRKEMLRRNWWLAILVNDYKLREDSFRLFIKEVKENSQYLSLMYSLAYEYLPKSAHITKPDLTLYYCAVGNDATSQNAGIVFSVRSAIEANKPRYGILEAHEMHHQLRPRIDYGTVAAQDMGLLWALDAIVNEGTADLIDKKPMLAYDPESIQSWLLDKAPGVLRSIDSAIAAAAIDTAASQPRKFYRNIMDGSSGHMPGFYMARIIEQNGFAPLMVKKENNPFAFVFIYQLAAQKDTSRPALFSAASLRFLKRLEKKYIPARYRFKD